MNQVIGYDVLGGRRFPRFSGPCKGCGATNYGLSTSGPDYCGSCAMGVDPGLSKLRREYDDLNGKFINALLALQIATGHKVEHMTPQMKAIGERALEQFKRDGTVTPYRADSN